MNLSTFIIIINIVSILYAIPYANYEFKNGNKKSAITTYIIALFLTILSYLNIKS